MQNNSKLAFNLTDNELEKLVNQYKKELDDGVFERASWPHFCAYLGFTEDEVTEVVTRAPDCSSTYYRRAVMLKRMATWIRGQMLSGKGWSGQNQSRAIFALQQPMGDSKRYANYRSSDGGTGNNQFIVSFGDNDQRSKKARK